MNRERERENDQKRKAEKKRGHVRVLLSRDQWNKEKGTEQDTEKMGRRAIE